MKMKNNKITLFLLIVLVGLIIAFIVIPPTRIKKVYLTKEEYKKELYDTMKAEQEEAERIKLEEEEAEKESQEEENNNEIDDELLKVQN